MNPIVDKSLAGALGVAVLAIGVAIGRFTALTKTVEKVKTVEVTKEVAAKTNEEDTHNATQADIRSVTHWRVRYVQRPDGTVVTSASGDSGKSSDRETTHETAKRETEIKYVDRYIDREKLVIKETEKPAWGVAARAGLSSGPRFVYGAEVSRRVLGPLWLGAYATTAKEAGVIARVEW